jgi:hypothetical protein
MRQVTGAENMNDETIEIVNPTGVRASKQIKLAQRTHENLRGMRVGLLDNNKPNADKFLDHVGALLKKRYEGIELVSRRKMTRIEADCLRELAGRCDVSSTPSPIEVPARRGVSTTRFSLSRREYRQSQSSPMNFSRWRKPNDLRAV